ncbi:hypothetical protein [Algoriphagus sp. C2-6-M1]|uniref:hypothetical protein n=1 Tax=Algoriphagus persicinus TaxID=3108754 RepID=UPI003A5CC419
MKSSMSQVTHRGMIINYARFSRSAAADGTGYLTNKNQNINRLEKLGIVTTLIGASSFTPKTGSVHEIRVDADIVDLAISQDFLTSLVAAVKAGDLVETWKGDGSFTVFALRNEAFA